MSVNVCVCVTLRFTIIIVKELTLECILLQNSRISLAPPIENVASTSGQREHEQAYDDCDDSANFRRAVRFGALLGERVVADWPANERKILFDGDGVSRKSVQQIAREPESCQFQIRQRNTDSKNKVQSNNSHSHRDSQCC